MELVLEVMENVPLDIVQMLRMSFYLRDYHEGVVMKTRLLGAEDKSPDHGIQGWYPLGTRSCASNNVS